MYRKSNYVHTKSTFQFSWQRLVSASGDRVFSFSFSRPTIHHPMLFWFLCAYFPPGSGTVKLLSSSRLGIWCHPKSPGLTGEVGGHWDTIQKARSEVLSQSDVNSRGGGIGQPSCLWTPALTAFSLKYIWQDTGHNISAHYILDSWNQLRWLLAGDRIFATNQLFTALLTNISRSEQHLKHQCACSVMSNSLQPCGL